MLCIFFYLKINWVQTIWEFAVHWTTILHQKTRSISVFSVRISLLNTCTVVILILILSNCDNYEQNFVSLLGQNLFNWLIVAEPLLCSQIWKWHIWNENDTWHISRNDYCYFPCWDAWQQMMNKSKQCLEHSSL